MHIRDGARVPADCLNTTLADTWWVRPFLAATASAALAAVVLWRLATCILHIGVEPGVPLPERRAGQVTHLAKQFNLFLPGGAKPIPLVDGRVYHPQDLECLVTAGYCALADLSNQVDPTKGWIWSDTTRRFTPEP